MGPSPSIYVFHSWSLRSVKESSGECPSVGTHSSPAHTHYPSRKGQDEETGERPRGLDRNRFTLINTRNQKMYFSSFFRVTGLNNFSSR